MTPMLNLSAVDPDAAATAAGRTLRQPGAVILVPTETVYGLVCRAADAAATARIYELKGRDQGKPLALFTADCRNLAALGVDLTGWPEKLAEKYCPGPITIVAPGPNGGTVGFRTPDHPFVLALLREIGEPLASTSANRSGEPNAVDVESALSMLSGPVDLAVDGGPIAPGALASTVVDATGDKLKILRPGPVSLAEELSRRPDSSS